MDKITKILHQVGGLSPLQGFIHNWSRILSVLSTPPSNITQTAIKLIACPPSTRPVFQLLLLGKACYGSHIPYSSRARLRPRALEYAAA